ncbi:hypothetical protein [Sporichthya sp.]|uniref:hypothetical protein n=1 Tax=Sporichthya sp. TaxID=65475 RepID=UPI0017B4EE95|nr:hypothetical protein [Sporichthya sp.]MBA3743020.1 hypothetical protein [Sporichthya sp.]
MSGLSMRARFTTVAVSAAIVAPFALMGGSANAVEAPVVDNVEVPVVGGLLDGVLGSATGGAGGLPGGASPLSTVTGLAADPLSATSVTDGVLGDVLDLDVLSSVTDLAGLEDILSTVTGLVDLDGIIKTVTDLVGTVVDTLNLDKLLALPVKILSPKGEVKGATKTTKAAKPTQTVNAGALPHTGGNADLTAMLLCAGLAVAGTGVTMVTRRRGGILGAA